MIGRLVSVVAVCTPLPATADTVFATRTLRPNTVIYADDIAVKPIDTTGAHSDPATVVGLEARVAIYAGRPVRKGDVGPAAVVERNQVVPLRFRRAGLVIQAEGRALARAGTGDWIRVMNLASRQTVTGQVMADGSVQLGQ